jgi:hypothetical protein
LALTDDLTDGIVRDLSKNLQTALNDVQYRIAVLANKNPDTATGLAAQVEKSLNGQADLLASVGAKANVEGRAALSKLENALRLEADAAKKLRIAAEEKAGGTLSEDRARAALIVATDSLGQAREKVASLKSSLDAGAATDAATQLTLAQHALVSGQSEISARDFVQATELLGTAQTLAAQAALYAETMASLKSTGNLQADSVLGAVKAKVESDTAANANVSSGADGGSSVTGGTDSGVSGEINKAEAGVGTDGILPDTGIDLDGSGQVIPSPTGSVPKVVNPL